MYCRFSLCSFTHSVLVLLGRVWHTEHWCYWVECGTQSAGVTGQSVAQRALELLGRVVLTSLGRSWVVLSPWPRRPYSPRPQLYSSPLEVMAALWELPQAMSRIRLVFRASIRRGLSQFLREGGRDKVRGVRLERNERVQKERESGERHKRER